CSFQARLLFSLGRTPTLVLVRPSNETILMARVPEAQDQCGCPSIPHPLSDKVSPHQYNAQPMATVDPAAPKQPLALPDPALMAATVETQLPFQGQFKTLAPWAGDASNRRYFRIELTGGVPRSMILMQL